MSEWDNDDQDSVLFRFWIRAASEFAGETAKAIATCTTPQEYRAALTMLAERKRINLPSAPDWAAIFKQAGDDMAAVRRENITLKAALAQHAQDIASVHTFPNGMVMTFDKAGAQMPAFQGATDEVLPLLAACGWKGEPTPSRLK